MFSPSRKIVLIGLVCWVSLVKCDEGVLPEDQHITDGLNKCLELLREAAKVLESNDHSRFIRAITTFAGNFSAELEHFGRTIANIFYLIDGEPQLFHVNVMEKLLVIKGMLVSILKKPRTIETESPKDKSILSDYSRRRKDILELAPFFQRISEDPSTYRRTKLLESCGRRSMGETLYWIEEEMTRNDSASLISLLTWGNSRTRLMSGSKHVMATFISGSILWDACFAIKFSNYNKSDFNRALAVGANKISGYLETIVVTIRLRDKAMQIDEDRTARQRANSGTGSRTRPWSGFASDSTSRHINTVFILLTMSFHLYF